MAGRVDGIPVLEKARGHVVLVVVVPDDGRLDSLGLAGTAGNSGTAQNPGKGSRTGCSDSSPLQVGGRGALMGMMDGGHGIERSRKDSGQGYPFMTMNRFKERKGKKSILSIRNGGRYC